MSRRVALIPEELISTHHYQDPELRLEDEIGSLLDRKKIPDDMKVKLLSQLVMRYQRTYHTPPEPIPVTVKNDQISANEKDQVQSDENSVENNYEKHDNIMKNILISTPLRFRKFVPMIVEKLKTRDYSWNSNGEMMVGNNPVKKTNVIDFFAYLLKNRKNQPEPYSFDLFLKALSEINIPSSWIANENVLKKLNGKNTDDDSSSYNETKVTPLMKRRPELETRSRSLQRWDRSRSRSPTKKKKWLDY